MGILMPETYAGFLGMAPVVEANAVDWQIVPRKRW